MSYPSAFIGSNYARGTSDSNLPKQISAIKSVQTGFSHNADGSIAGQYNATYDVWFSTNAGGDAQAPSGGYLMLWLFDPSNEQPIGSLVQAGATVAGMPGADSVGRCRSILRRCDQLEQTWGLYRDGLPQDN